MELSKYLALLAVVLPVAYGAPAETANTLHPDLLEAMKRDLGMTTEQAVASVQIDKDGSILINQLESSTGGSFAGGWMKDGEVFVGITDESMADEIKATGATPVVMTNSLSKLQNAHLALDKVFANDNNRAALSSTARSSIGAWYVDVAANKFVIEAIKSGRAEAEKLAAQTGLTTSEFEVRIVNDMPMTAATIRGGDAYYINNQGRCSIGFAVQGGFATAGHCGKRGATITSTKGGANIGTVADSTFPGRDTGHVRTVQGTTLTNRVNGYGAGDYRVTGHNEIAVGGRICRSGSTTGVKCGTLSQKNTSVNYPEGTVNGVYKSTACCEPGDSGGSWFSGAEAQGVTSGTSGKCDGGQSWYVPINSILSAYSLTLITS